MSVVPNTTNATVFLGGRWHGGALEPRTCVDCHAGGPKESDRGEFRSTSSPEVLFSSTCAARRAPRQGRLRVEESARVIVEERRTKANGDAAVEAAGR